MNTKNFNVFEVHVEKLVLALAAAGAGYMVWMAMQPVMIDTNEGPVEVNNVEQRVTAAVDRLKKAEMATEKLGKLEPKIEDYANRYKKLMELQPLGPQLVNAAVPAFVPRQVAVVPMNLQQPKLGEGEIVTPVVPAPENVTATSWRGIVATALVSAAGIVPPSTSGVPATSPVPTKDQNLVVVQGTLPLEAFIRGMQAVMPVEERLPANNQKTIVYQIECERRPRMGGAWGTWETFTPQNKSDLPNFSPDRWNNDKKDQITFEGDLKTIQDNFTKIAQPESYVSPDGKPILSLLLKGDAGAAQPGGTSPAPAPVAPGAGSSNSPQFWIVDDQVKPGNEYQYRVRLVMYDPLFNWSGKLKDKAMRDQPLINSTWAVAAGSAEVQADQYLFVGPSGIGDDRKVAAQVFKWTAGSWYVGTSYASPGSIISAHILLLERNSLDVNTGYIVVDIVNVQHDEVNPRDDTDIILMTPTGELESRSTYEQEHNPRRETLTKEKHVTSPTTKPAPTTRPSSTTQPRNPLR